MSDARQVKVDNWGIYFLHRLKHFFNRTDYCDLTLQFQDNAQLKVHRLVLSACTEYFELLERTCEMYEDCLVMPDDLQADVVVPIINFMYTGQLEFKLELLEKLYQTSLVMDLPILTKLLEAHRPIKKLPPAKPAKPAFTSSANFYTKRYSKTSTSQTPHHKTVASSSSNKRSFSTAFDNTELDPIDVPKMKKPSSEMFSKAECIIKNGNSSSYQFPVFSDKNKNLSLKEPRPTRYELPEELDEEHLFDNSFTNISYGSKPLMVHPETVTKQYAPKRINLFDEGSSSSRFMSGSANDIVECRKISTNESIFLDPLGDSMQDESTFQSTSNIDAKDNSVLFDQILENKSSKITIETKNSAQTQNLDHAKIISEVLKKYPHLVKSNKNIKLKILNTTKTKKSNSTTEEKAKSKHETPDFTYESDVLNSKEAAKLIALGAENVAGPWICLICGTPGKALHFTSYFNFRKHLVEIHNEKPIPSICEYCGVKSQKRNYIVHHKLTKHGVPAPPAYNFPKCNHCSYIALNEALLVKHKTNHTLDKAFKYNLPSTQMSQIAQKTGKKYPTQSVDKISKMQCVYCMRVFLREHNLYAHLKISHKEAARNDGLIDDSEEEQEEEKFPNLKIAKNEPSDNMVKLELPVSFENSYEDVNEQYQIEQKPDGSICVSAKKPRVLLPANKNKILNLGFSSAQQNLPSVAQSRKTDSMQNTSLKRNEFPQNTYHSQTRPTSSEDTVIIDDDEYFLQDNQLIKKEKVGEYLVSHASNDAESTLPTTSVEYHSIHNSNPERKMLGKKSTQMTQPYQIVVSSEEEYKALMQSNQAILYDDGEQNKVLPELGDPDSSLGTGPIDLDNTQSNDMMIIPDYHMNVPETVSADNSNIVVVYSHPVEEPNKQYSLITTQGHFVQPSAIITQNYETVTTCTPMMNTHTTVEGSWQNNINATINKHNVTPPAELQTMTVGESITISPMENLHSNNLNEITEVQLTAAAPVTIEVAQTETCTNTFDESNIITTISQPIDNALICQQNAVITLADATVLSNMQHQGQIQSLSNINNDQINSVTSFEAESVNMIEEQTTTADEVTPNSQESTIVEEILHTNDNDTPSTEIVTVNEAENNLTCDSIIEDTNSLVNNTTILSENTVDESNPITDHSTVAEEVSEEGEQFQESGIEAHIEEEEETIENIARDISESQNKEQCITTDQTKEVAPLIEIAKEHIENLTSEWSEEENEITVAEESTVSNANVVEQNDDVTALAETEESIENIQKEVNKQVSGELAVAEDDIPSLSDSPGNSQTDTKKSETVTPIPHEKISSLLNDWDDNDSQEEDTPANNDNDPNIQSSNIETPDENISTVIIDNSVTNDNIVTDDNDGTVDKGVINKNDNIRSLVSDWDEDEEEENRD
ncbi:centrosome-associated zinc finger protein CP190-like [Maniola jurtina]|uniref:centrosome-associated zinc finger protein CP190-like n=1 Tax=Maniola jurtina TaxID=191418 RepID=UPI001E687C3D|nr:centrosome-associated zinc finger protein CP190-like [Maniola jurtina]XP_045776126.1 centrosome-associated zinc finger protein CP190-like [Maniola jurtina]